MAINSSSVKPVILCGGSGTRLWPLSREGFPKQFVPLIDGRSLLELTIERVASLMPPICIANEEYRFFVQDLLQQSLSGEAYRGEILLEPAGRNTAAAMASAALLPDIASTDLLLFLSSDHFIPDLDKFNKTIHQAIDAARAGYIVTFGVTPTFPSTAYGYIQKGDLLAANAKSSNEVLKVERFTEKPSLDMAQDMVLSGNYLWNAGIFLCQAGILIDAMQEHAPDILTICKKAVQESTKEGQFIRPNKEAFLACRSESIDYAVMEHFNKVAVVPFQGIWSDVGNWNAVANLVPPNEDGNRIHGQGLAIAAKETFINAPHRPVVALGTSNLLIVDTPDAVLVADSEHIEQVKDVVDQLKKNRVSQASAHRRVARPWGWYDLIDMGERFQVKRIAVKPGASLSLQLHHHRAEHWVVVKGTAKVTNGDQVFLLEENQSTYIPIGVKHRLENPGKTDLEMIEVQSGSYLGEDDIVRLEDNYGRN